MANDYGIATVIRHHNLTFDSGACESRRWRFEVVSGCVSIGQVGSRTPSPSPDRARRGRSGSPTFSTSAKTSPRGPSVLFSNSFDCGAETSQDIPKC